MNPQSDVIFANDYLDEINHSNLADINAICTGLISAILECLSFYSWVIKNTSYVGMHQKQDDLADAVAANVPIFWSHCEILLTAQVLPVDLLIDFLRKANVTFNHIGTIDSQSVTVCNFKKFTKDFDFNFVENLRAELFSESHVRSLEVVAEHTDTFQKYLDLVPDECVRHLIDLSNVYILSILRFCASNVENEDVLVGIANPTAEKRKEHCGMKNVARSRRSKQQVYDVYLCDAKNITSICSSNITDQRVIECLEYARNYRTLVDLAPSYEKVSAEVIFHARWNASRSLHFLGGILSKIFLSPNNESNVKQESNEVIKIIRDRVHALTEMSTLCMKISCLRSIGPIVVLSRIASTDWCTDIMHTRANSFIDDLARRIEDLSSGIGCKVVNDDMIHSLIDVAYLTILEGYAFISHCSVQGRALMGLDLMHFRDCLLSAHLVSFRFSSRHHIIYYIVNYPMLKFDQFWY